MPNLGDGDRLLVSHPAPASCPAPVIGGSASPVFSTPSRAPTRPAYPPPCPQDLSYVPNIYIAPTIGYNTISELQMRLERVCQEPISSISSSISTTIEPLIPQVTTEALCAALERLASSGLHVSSDPPSRSSSPRPLSEASSTVLDENLKRLRRPTLSPPYFRHFSSSNPSVASFSTDASDIDDEAKSCDGGGSWVRRAPSRMSSSSSDVLQENLTRLRRGREGSQSPLSPAPSHSPRPLWS